MTRLTADSLNNMDNKKIRQILNSVKSGKVNVKDALESLKHLPYEDIGIATVDHHRELRHGIPEVIFAAGKDQKDIKVIAASMIEKSGRLLITKASRTVFKDVNALCKKKNVKAKFFEKS